MDFLRQVTGEEPTTSDIGTPDELVARVEELAAAGVQYFVFNMPTGFTRHRAPGGRAAGRAVSPTEASRLLGAQELRGRRARGQAAGDRGHQDGESDGEDADHQRRFRPGTAGSGTALISPAKRFHSTRPRAMPAGIPTAHPMTAATLGLHGDGHGELPSGETERLENGQVAPAAAHRRHQRDAERGGGAGGQSGSEQHGVSCPAIRS